MTMIRRMQDRRLLTLYFAGAFLVLLVAGLLAGVALKTDYQRRMDGAERDSQNLARAFEEHIYRTFRSLDQQSRFLAEYYFRYPDKDELTEALRGLLRIEDAAVQHAIIDEHGILAGSSVGTQSLGINLSDRAHFRHYLQPDATPTYVSKPLVGRASGKASIQYTRRIEDSDGEFRGVAVVSFDPLYLNSFYQSVDVGERGVISLAGTDGILRARSIDMDQTIGKDISGGELMRSYQSAPAGTYRAPSGVDGIERIVSYRKVRDFPLLVVVGLGLGDVMAGYTGYVASVGGLYGFLLVTLVLLGGVLRNFLRNRTEAERLARETVVERRERQFLSSILQTAGVLVVVAEADGTIKVANPLFARYFGAGSGARAWSRAATGEEFAALVTGLPRSFEAQVSDLGGIRRTVAWTFTAVTDDGGELRNLVGIGLDNTERRAAELMIYQSAKLVTLGEMATGLAHELNQPLNAIKLTVENVLLRSGRGTPEKTYLDDKLDKIRRNVARAASIIDHMRIFGRRAERTLGPVDPAQACEGALSITNAPLRLANIACHVICPAGMYWVRAEIGLLEQVLINLILNARDAILSRREQHPETGRADHIELSAQPLADGRMQISVTDTGGGVPEALMQRIFEPFFTTKPVGQGTGLGLSLSYGIVRDFGGELRVENIEGGACFLVELPAATPATGPAALPVPAPQAQAQAAQ